jgi:hypothetical protein
MSAYLSLKNDKTMSTGEEALFCHLLREKNEGTRLFVLMPELWDKLKEEAELHFMVMVASPW